MVYLQNIMLRFFDLLGPEARASLLRNTTVVIALVTEANQPHLVYTVAGNSINPQIRNAAEQVGATRLDPEGIATIAGEHHAEQLAVEAAEKLGFKVHGMAVSRTPCADCGPRIAEEGIPIAFVRDPVPAPRAPRAPPGGPPPTTEPVTTNPPPTTEPVPPEGATPSTAKPVTPKGGPPTPATTSTVPAEAPLTEETIAQEVVLASEGRGSATIGGISRVGGRTFAVLKVAGIVYVIYSITQIRSLRDAGALAATLGVGFAASLGSKIVLGGAAHLHGSCPSS